jgi:hypothetical protein
MNFIPAMKQTLFYVFYLCKHLTCAYCFLLIFLLPFFAHCQDKEKTDSTEKNNSNILRLAMNAVTRSPGDSAKESTVLNAKSELQFMPYEGKIIRHIYIETYGFERNFADTLKQVDYYGTRLLNSLHKDTREWVIRNNLFIKKETEN